MQSVRHRNYIIFYFRRVKKWYLFLIATVLLFGLNFSVSASAPKSVKRVLVLFPGQSDLATYPLAERGIKSALAAGAEFRIEYFIEYMDRYRYSDQTHYQQLLALYRHKYTGKKIDLIIAFSAPALLWVTAHGDEIFPQTPVVFTAILEEHLESLHLKPNITGVLADIDFVGLLETALNIHPRTQHVAIVNGASKTDVYFEKKIRNALQPYENRLDLIYLTRLPLEKIAEEVQNLPERAVVLFYLLARDGAGKGIPPWEAASIVANAANAPVYGCLETYLGHGIVGGRLSSINMSGVKAGEMGLRILRGAEPSDIPPTGEGTILNLFDGRALKRWAISEIQLPPDSIVRFEVPSFWDLYRGYIAGAILLILAAGGLISHLLIQRRRLRRSESGLADRGTKGGENISSSDITDRKVAGAELQEAYHRIEQLKNQLEAEMEYLREEIKSEHNVENIVGNSAAIQFVLSRIEQAAATNSPVLVLGETGTGKELVSRAVHSRCQRKQQPLVKVNCVARPQNLLESELFGHGLDASTSAHNRRRGCLEVANGASVFIDEIGELPLELQKKLLRVLQDGEIETLDGSRTIKVDVRVIAATNRDLEDEVTKGRFREDLFYCLNAFVITVPPLRSRIEDIPLLTDFFVKKSSNRLGKSIELIPRNITNRLQNYHWPGNVRELESVIERAVINSSGSNLQLMDNLMPQQKDSSKNFKTIEAIEFDHIVRVLEHTNWKVSGKDGAAEILGLKRGTLRARIQKLGIQKP
jgi:DNA-binding NtrC family response regulator/ABC-type uncharacterized transport system substrate-binding protein